jgi:UPF0271 protein
LKRGSGGGSDSKRAYVLDTAALILGFRGGANLYTTDLAIKEVVYGEIQVARLEAMLAAGIIKTIQPSTEALTAAKEIARKKGYEISETDESILATALDLAKNFEEVYVVTDDYAIQSLAKSLGLKFIPLKLPGIRKRS